MEASKIVLKTEGSGRAKKKTPQDRKVVSALCAAIVAMIALGTYYTQQQPITSDIQISQAQVETQQSPLDQACRDKLIGYIEQGGVDLESKMHYGDLRSCNFSSASELIRQQRAVDKKQRSWSSQSSAQ